MHRALLLLLGIAMAAFAARAETITAGPDVPIGRTSGVPSRKVLVARNAVDVASSGSMALAVWIDSSESAIYATRIGLDGKPLDGFSIRVAAIPQPQQLFVKWNGTKFVVVWELLRETGNTAMISPEHRIAAAEITPAGRVLQPGGVEIASGVLDSVASVGGRTVIVARPLRADHQCALSTIVMLGEGLTTQSIANPASPCRVVRVGVNGDGFVMVWFEIAVSGQEAVGRDLWAQRFRTTGEMTDPVPLRIANALNLPNPATVVGDSAGNTLIRAGDYNFSSILRITPELAVTRSELGPPFGRNSGAHLQPLDDGRYASSVDFTLDIVGSDGRLDQSLSYTNVFNVMATLLGSRIYVLQTSVLKQTLFGTFLDAPADPQTLSLTVASGRSPVIAATPGGGVVTAWAAATDIDAARLDPGAQQLSPAVRVGSDVRDVLAIAADDVGPIVASQTLSTGELQVARLTPLLAFAKSSKFLPVDGGSRVALASNGSVVIAAWMTDGVPYWSSVFGEGIRFFNYVTPSKATLLSLASNGSEFMVLSRTAGQRLHVTRIAADGIHATSSEVDSGVTDAAVCAVGDKFLIVEQIGNDFVIGSRVIATAAADTLAIASNGTSVLLVWRDAGTHQIAAMPLTAQGTPTGAPVTIGIGELAPTGVIALSDGTYAVAYIKTAGENSGPNLRVFTLHDRSSPSTLDPL